MAFIDWTEDLQLGITSIDSQHRELFNIINLLHDGMEKREDSVILNATILSKMMDYAAAHFATEEKLFAQFGYQEGDKHKELHNEFIEKLGAFQQRLIVADKMVSSEIMIFLSKWWQYHILECDKAYVPFLKEHGVN